MSAHVLDHISLRPRDFGALSCDCTSFVDLAKKEAAPGGHVGFVRTSLAAHF